MWVAIFIFYVTILTHWRKNACCSVRCVIFETNCAVKMVAVICKIIFYENVKLNNRDNVLSDWCTVCDAYTRVPCVYTESLKEATRVLASYSMLTKTSIFTLFTCYFVMPVIIFMLWIYLTLYFNFSYWFQLIHKMSFWHEGQEGQEVDVVKVSLYLYLCFKECPDMREYVLSMATYLV